MMKSLLCLTVLVAFVALLDAAAVQNPLVNVQARGMPSEALVNKIKQGIADRALKRRVDNMIMKLKFRKAIMKEANDNGIKFLCKPCKVVFTDVIGELESVEKITAPILKGKIDDACKKYLGSVPFIEQSCDKIGEAGVDDLLTWLLAEEDKINPERTCTYLHLC